MKKKFYNLIEITMAIAVVGIGISAVMGLFPAALNATKDTVANNYIGGIAETFSSYLESQMKRPLTTAEENAIKSKIEEENATLADDKKKEVKVSMSDTPWYKLNAKIQGKPSLDWTKEGNERGTVEKHLTYDASNTFAKKIDGFHGLYEFDGDARVYAVKSADDSFTGFLLVWSETVSDIYGSSGEIDSNKLVRVYMELSWPAAAPYTKREKRLFMTEFCNPNYVAP